MECFFCRKKSNSIIRTRDTCKLCFEVMKRENKELIRKGEYIPVGEHYPPSRKVE